MTPWVIKATGFSNCNCAYGCPCQFNALPTYGNCRAMIGYQIHGRHFGETKLDGLRAAMIVAWPGAIHEGNGAMQLVIDERADPQQRTALVKILSGGETEPMATIWSVIGAMCRNNLDPLYRPIESTADVEARRAHFAIRGVVEAAGEPIRNPVSGTEHRVRIDFPQSFEFRIAESGSGTTTATGAITLDLKDSHAYFADIHLGNSGRLN
ncbi:MAG TPA: DUF1326 domain-containing protein [Stellaceae bacterium]|nr:DUF1326 domain-containing protein [Stellaceae bacterium]